MSDFDDPGAVAAADQDLARINRLLDAMIKAWQVSQPVLASQFPDPMTQLASLSFTLFLAADPDAARAFATEHQIALPELLPDGELLGRGDLPCLLAIAVDRLAALGGCNEW